MKERKVDYIKTQDTFSEIHMLLEQAVLMANDMDSDLFSLDEDSDRGKDLIAWQIKYARTRNDILQRNLREAIELIDVTAEENKQSIA